MPNTSKMPTIRHFIFLTFAILFSAQTQADSAQTRDTRHIKRKAENVLDVSYDQGFGRLFLKYSPSQRKIWIESENKKINKIVYRLERNANPEMVGAEKNIRFVTKKSVSEGNQKYIGVIVAERSMRGDGRGQCGAGSEEYFLAYKLVGHTAKEIHRSLIHSCIHGMMLDYGDGNNNDFSVTFDGEAVEFRWLIYPETDLYVVGRYKFATNKLEKSFVGRN